MGTWERIRSYIVLLLDHDRANKHLSLEETFTRFLSACAIQLQLHRRIVNIGKRKWQIQGYLLANQQYYLFFFQTCDRIILPLFSSTWRRRFFFIHVNIYLINNFYGIIIYFTMVWFVIKCYLTLTYFFICIKFSNKTND